MTGHKVGGHFFIAEFSDSEVDGWHDTRLV